MSSLYDMHLNVPFAFCNPLVNLLKGEHLDVDKNDGHRLVLVVPLVPERHSPDPVPDVGHSDGALSAQAPWAEEVVRLKRFPAWRKIVSPDKG